MIAQLAIPQFFLSGYMGSFFLPQVQVRRRLSRIVLRRMFQPRHFQQDFSFQPEWVEFTFPGSKCAPTWDYNQS